MFDPTETTIDGLDDDRVSDLIIEAARQTLFEIPDRLFTTSWGEAGSRLDDLDPNTTLTSLSAALAPQISRESGDTTTYREGLPYANALRSVYETWKKVGTEAKGDEFERHAIMSLEDSMILIWKEAVDGEYAEPRPGLPLDVFIREVQNEKSPIGAKLVYQEVMASAVEKSDLTSTPTKCVSLLDQTLENTRTPREKRKIRQEGRKRQIARAARNQRPQDLER